jgi:hypothetical protein
VLTFDNFHKTFIPLRLRAGRRCEPNQQGGPMLSKRTFLHLGFAVAAATLTISSASALPAYHGSARGGGTVTARDDAARTFTAARRNRAWTYQVNDKTRFTAGGKEASWWDVRVGSVVQVRWHRAGSQRVADVVGISARSGN